MSRLEIARTLNGLGVMSATVGCAVGLLGIIGVIVISENYTKRRISRCC